MLEDAEDYRAFELAITSEFEGRTAVERELVLRLASLLGRLRRATAIDAGLLTLHSEAAVSEKQPASNARAHDESPVPDRDEAICMPDASAASAEETSRGSQDADGWQATDCQNPNGDNRRNEGTITGTQSYFRAPRLRLQYRNGVRFLRLISLDKGAIERAQPLRNRALAPSRSGSRHTRMYAVEAMIELAASTRLVGASTALERGLEQS